MKYTILDCYTDEASGLGVPPYLGTYPRYIYGQLKTEWHEVSYITIDDLRLWMEEHEYTSIRQMQGSMSYRSVANPSAFERANYMKVLSSYALRTGAR